MAGQKRRGEAHEQRLSFYAKPSFKDALDKHATKLGTGMSEILRDATENYINGLLPVIGTIPCGPLAPAIEQTPYFEVAPPLLRPRAVLGDYLLECSGDSMSPRIDDGDLVLLRPDVDWSEGAVCAVQLYHDKGHNGECEATLKRVFHGKTPDRIILRAYNPDYADKVVPAESVKIVGVMKGVIKK